MRTSRLCVAGFAIALAGVATYAPAQVGHPAKGSWLGYWGPNDSERNRILLVLDWENREIVGTINPGPNAVPIDRKLCRDGQARESGLLDQPAVLRHLPPRRRDGDLHSDVELIRERFACQDIQICGTRHLEMSA